MTIERDRRGLQSRPGAATPGRGFSTRRVVADYVPFYFAARSPMFGSIHKGHVSSYSGGQEEVVYLVTDVERVVEAGLEFVFTDRNAALDVARFENDPTRVGTLVDWPLMEARMWNNTS